MGWEKYTNAVCVYTSIDNLSLIEKTQNRVCLYLVQLFIGPILRALTTFVILYLDSTLHNKIEHTLLYMVRPLG